MKNIDIIANSEVAKRGDMVEFNKLNELTKTNLSIDKEYQKVADKIDLDNFIDYFSLMIYSANIDWIRHNTRCWRERKDGAKWRWMLDDLDMGFGMYSGGQNFFEVATGSYTYHSDELKADTTLSRLFKSLLKNSTFRDRFKSRFTTLLDCTFKASNLKALANQLWDKRKDIYISLKYPQDSIDNFLSGDFKDFADDRVSILKTQLEEFLKKFEK